MGSEKNAILTETQRGYLDGDEEPPQERTTNTRIRKRLQAGLDDIALITNAANDNEINFDRRDVENAASDAPIINLVIFLCMLKAEPEDLKRTLEIGIESSLLNEGWRSEVNIEIDVKRTERIDNVHTRVSEGGPEMFGEVLDLVRAGKIDGEEYNRLAEEWRSSDE